MIARLLNLCGLYLGPEDRIMPAHTSNQAGFWENLDVCIVNDAILQKLGGGWDFLPSGVEAGWEQSPELDVLRERAESIIRVLSEQEPWGWKDPRFCFLLPFWQSFLPVSKIIICLRHPLDVAGSLMKRNGHSMAFGQHLWLDHYRRLLNQTEPEQRIVTHYDAYFINPQQELRRLVDWLGWSVSEKTISQACETVSSNLRHQRRPRRHGGSGDMPDEVARLYSALESDAGPIYNEEHPTEGDPQASDTAASALPLPETAAPGQKDLPPEARTLYGEARKLVEAQKFEASITALKALLEAFPEYAAVHNDLAVVYFQTGNKSEALRHLERAAKLDPHNFNTLRNLGDVYLATGRVEEALAIYERVTQGEPRNADAWLMRASANCQLGRIDDARESLNRTLQINPEHPAAGELLKAINLLARP
jgi:tetratricopeptide (TPR) repeat protein